MRASTSMRMAGESARSRLPASSPATTLPRMANVRPFLGVRPPRELAEQVAAPPYDVVSTEEARALAGDNPHAFFRVSRPEIELADSVDPHSEQVYALGKKNLE